MSQNSDPFFSFFPALPLSKPVQLGEWCIGTPDPKVPWRSPRFEELARKHLNAFTKEDFKNGALMWHCERGFDGSKPEPQVWGAIRATMCFVALDANDHISRDLNTAYYLVTSENAELYTQPIDVEKGYIAIRDGGLLKAALTGGWKIGEETASLPDAVVAVHQPVVLSQRLATALFAALLDSSNPVNRRISIALEWHRFALCNPRVVDWGQRLLSLKTGFEALSGTSKSHECASFLRQLFENATRPHHEHLPWAGLLWSPRERNDLVRTWMQKGKPQRVVRSELEDWFMALSERRNEIIHDGTLTSLVYEAPPERPLSRYAGLLFWTADRVLREAVKALLGADVLLCALLKEAKAWKEFCTQQQAMLEENGTAPMVAADGGSNTTISDHDTAMAEPTDIKTASPEPNDDYLDGELSEQEGEGDDAPTPDPGETSAVDRDLATLLAALKCDAANKVRLERLPAERALWRAKFEKLSMSVNRAERDVLVGAGAEFPLPPYWDPCE